MANDESECDLERVRNALVELEERVIRLEATKAQRDRAKQHVDEQPTVIDLQDFRDDLSTLELNEIAEMRYHQDVWGNYDPQDSRKSSWKVREANRYLTAEQQRLKREEERERARGERLLQWVAIVVSTLIGLAGVIVAILGL